MSFEGGNLSETDLLQCICNFCKCYLNIPPIRIVDGKFACGRCGADGVDVPLVEIIMKLMTLPCRFKILGCKELVKWNDVHHELVCVYNKRKCIVSGCYWQAAYRELPAHIAEQHTHKLIIPRQKIKVEPSMVSSHNFVYVDGNRIFPVSFSIAKNGLNYYVSAVCAKPQLRYYKYDLSIHQNDVIIVWSSQKLVAFGDATVNENNIPLTHLPCFFDKSKILEISICVYIDNIAPPSNDFYATMDNFKCHSCLRKFFPCKNIICVNSVLKCSGCYNCPQYAELQLQTLLLDLDCRPLSLSKVLWKIKCATCKGIMSNEFRVRNMQWYCSKKCDVTPTTKLNTPTTKLNTPTTKLNTDSITFFKNLLSLMN